MRKNLILCGLLFFSSLSIEAQQIPKKLVLVEKWSGTWCYPCTGAARALAQMSAENQKIALISYQIEQQLPQKEKYETEEGRSRMEYYGNVNSYPTTCFDGTLFYKIGSPTGTIYPEIMPMYEERNSLKTSFDLSVTSLQASSTMGWNATILVEKVADYSTKNLKLRVALVERGIPQFWYGMDELHYVQRDMFPDASGTPVILTDKKQYEVTINGTVKESWNKDELELICFLQDDDTKEVLQTISHPLYRTKTEKKGTRTFNFDEIEYYWYMVSPFQGKLKHYNVYSADEKLLARVDASENVFKYKSEKAGGFDIRVSAVYEEGETEKSEILTGASFRKNLSPSPQNLNIEEGEDKKSLSWGEQSPIDNGHVLYSGYCPLTTNNEGTYDVEKKGGALMSEAWVVYRLGLDDCYNFHGWNLSQISFIPGDVNAGYSVGVFKDGELVYSKDISKSKLEEGKWHTHQLANPFFITGRDIIEVGYKITDLSNMPILIDKGPVRNPGKSNLVGVLSDSGITWSELYSGNNIIDLGFNIPASQGVYPSSYTFKGYMVYHDGVRLTPTPINTFTFELPAHISAGECTVTCLYEECESLPSNSVSVGTSNINSTSNALIRVYPRQDKKTICISGKYQWLELYDLYGRKLMCVDHPVEELALKNQGVYLLKIKCTNGDMMVKKVIVN